MQIIQVKTENHIAKTRQLFKEYAEHLDFDLDFQNFQDELRSLPGTYSEPNGVIFLAKDKGKIAGCIALRPIDDLICEMKRLYIRPQFRSKGYGRALAKRILVEARKMHYKKMRLDTVTSMTAAISLYQSMGFKDIPPYCHNPLNGARYFELDLRT